jgi:hypothetical protein
MKQLFWLMSLLVLTAFGLSGCREKAQTTTPPTAATAAPPAQTVTLPANASGSPLPAGSVNPNQAVAVPGQMPKSLDAIPEQLRRPLTLDEIKKLPPESRDMILKAIGQPVPSPTAKK